MPTIETTLGSVFVEDLGTPKQPAALLWPSLFTDHSMWRHQIPPLRAAGWRTLALDPPGHGRSQDPGRRFSMDECARVAVEVLDAAQIDEPVVYLATSWGGFVAPRLAQLAPERIRAMVLFNTSAERGSALERTRAMILTKLMALRPLDPLTANLIVTGLLSPDTRRAQPQTAADLVRDLSIWDRRALITAVQSVLLDRDSALEMLPKVAVPTLVVSGQQDHTIPPVHGERIAEQLPHARHVQVPGAAHLVPLEQPQLANDLIRDFLQLGPAISRHVRGAQSVRDA